MAIQIEELENYQCQGECISGDAPCWKDGIGCIPMLVRMAILEGRRRRNAEADAVALCRVGDEQPRPITLGPAL